MFGRRDTRYAKDRGSALVETALILIVVLLLLEGMVELGLALRICTIISEASHVAARYASLCPSDTTGIQDMAIQMAQQNGINLSREAITISGQSGGAGQPISVTVTYSVNTPLLGAIYQLMGRSPLNTVPMTCTTVMRIANE